MLRRITWIFLIYFCQVKAGYGPYDPVIPKDPDNVHCTGDQCLRVEDLYYDNILEGIEPCDDFFKYACGKNRGDINVNESDYISTLEAILNKDTSNQDYNEFDFMRALNIERDIYLKCTERGVRDNYEKTEYDKLLRTYEADGLESNGNYESVSDWTEVDAKYALDGFGFAFFDVEVRSGGYWQPSKRYIQISPPKDNIFRIRDLLVKKYEVNSKDDYIGRKYGKLSAFIEKFIQIKVKYDDDDRNSDELQPFEPTMIKDWQDKYNSMHANHRNSKIDFKKVLTTLFGVTQDRITDHEQIIVKDERYFFELARKVLNIYDKSTIVKYIHLRFVSKTIGFVNNDYLEYSIIPQVKGLKCTPGLLIATAHAYARKYFPMDTKITVTEIFENEKKLLSAQLQSNKFKHNDVTVTTKKFLRRLEDTDLIIGYPDWVINGKVIGSFYEPNKRKDFKILDMYLQNILKSVRVMLYNKLRSLRDSDYPIINMDDFFKSFLDENWDIPNNFEQIIVPARVFSEKHYKLVSSQLFNPINYGSAGTEIAAKLYSRWLKNIRDIGDVPTCVKQQLVSHVNGRSKDHEFIHQATSYMLALNNSYQSWPNKKSYPIQFPHFGALPDSYFFFLSFAESVCQSSMSRDEQEVIINFVLTNSQEFSEDFQCYRYSKLNLHKKQKLQCEPLLHY